MNRLISLALLLKCSLAVVIAAAAASTATNQWEQLGSAILLSSSSSKLNGQDATEGNVQIEQESLLSLASSPLVVEVSDSGLRVAVGSPSYDDGLGAVFLFEWQDQQAVPASQQIDESIQWYDWTLIGSILGNHGKEGLGDSFSLSGDGRWLAVRRNSRPQGRNSPSSRVVQVYHFNTDGVMQQVGDDVACPGEDNDGESVALGQAPLLSDDGDFINQIWLILGCEKYDNSRGMVQVFNLGNTFDTDGEFAVQSIKTWQPYLPPLQGTYPGDKFGSAVAFVEYPTRTMTSLVGNDPIFRLAVSSPNYDNHRGKVRVYTGYSHGWATLGTELRGSSPGELFGWDIDMSTSKEPYLIVASPGRTPADGNAVGNTEAEQSFPGSVRVFHWKAKYDSVASLFEWNLAGKPLSSDLESFDGTSDARFGYSVAISRDSNRIAISSATITSDKRARQHDSNAVHVYNRDYLDDSVIWELADDISIASDSLCTPSVGLNGYGSVAVIVSYTGCGRVDNMFRAFLDVSPFCTPSKLTEDTALNGDRSQIKQSDPLKSFFDRTTCRDSEGDRLISSRETCSKTQDLQNDTLVRCAWATGLPSPSPTSSPTAKGFGRPTRSPITELGRSEAPVEPDQLRACRCDSDHECTDEPLSKGLSLHACITGAPSMNLLSIDSFFLEQGSILVSVIEGGQALSSVSEDVTIDCIANSCTAHVPVNPFFFGSDRSPYLTFKGSAIVARSLKTSQQIRQSGDEELPGLLWMESFQSLVPLQWTGADGYAERSDISEKSNPENYFLLGLRWLFGALVFAACFTMWMQRRLRLAEQRYA